MEVASFKPPNGRERRLVSCVGEKTGFEPKTLRAPRTELCQLRLVPTAQGAHSALPTHYVMMAGDDRSEKASTYARPNSLAEIIQDCLYHFQMLFLCVIILFILEYLQSSNERKERNYCPIKCTERFLHKTVMD